MASIIYKGIEYSEGDIISFKRKNINRKNSPVRDVQGILKLGSYMDAEMYQVIEHFGFYVDVEGESSETLPDAIMSGGKKIE